MTTLLVTCRRSGMVLEMSTLMEIESAVTALPPTQQRSLLVWLQSLVEAKPVATPQRPTRREA